MSKIPKRRRAGQRVRRPKNLAQFDALPKRSQVAWDKTGSVVTRVRKGESLRAASLELGIDSRTVMRLAGSALRKNAGGRYVASPTDSLLRVLRVPVHGGSVEVGLPGSRASTAASIRSDAQRHFNATGDDAEIQKLARKKLRDADGQEVPFLTDLDELERQGDLGTFSFESIYARRA